MSKGFPYFPYCETSEPEEPTSDDLAAIAAAAAEDPSETITLEEYKKQRGDKEYMRWPEYTVDNARFFALNSIDGLPAEIFCIEECSELQKELTKTLRNKGDRAHIVEELTDVFLTMSAIRYKYGISAREMQVIIDTKLKDRHGRDN